MTNETCAETLNPGRPVGRRRRACEQHDNPSPASSLGDTLVDTGVVLGSGGLHDGQAQAAAPTGRAA